MTTHGGDHMACLMLFAETWSLDWSKEYLQHALQQVLRYDVDVLRAATTALCRTSGDRPWNPLAELLEACDKADAKKTARLAPAQMVLPTIPGATYDEVLPYARPATQPFTHADLRGIRDKIQAARDRAGPKPRTERWRPSGAIRRSSTSGVGSVAREVVSAAQSAPTARAREGGAA